ncbi:MAG: HlyD family efflux transporter periplasmic adaptor subunit, partial [Isosphaeraceae bacterium]|nr:HlyD family efflux transporter periplasmic adaptor subunit [Isosphaeraceae bacterium]
MGQQQVGSTQIIFLEPEGNFVRAGQVVCRLDSSAFEDELQAQLIRHAQAKAFVDQAAEILKVSELELQEYREGIYKQDLLLIQNYIKTCRVELGRAKEAFEWSQDMYRKKLRSEEQYKADRYALERAELALREALVMEERLVKYTAPKIIREIEAKIESIRADKLAQEETFQREDERKRKLETMIARCTLTAPRDGIVVYSKPVNSWGRPEGQIAEGVTVREGQAIFELPDPKQMRVRVRVNESKVGPLRVGQEAVVWIDAFPERPFPGRLVDLSPIPAPAQMFNSDVKVYYALVDLETGDFDGLCPGLSAEVEFEIDARRDVVRIPLRAIRWVEDEPYVALATPTGPAWRKLSLGLMNATHAEVITGVAPGDLIVADPSSLTAPR